MASHKWVQSADKNPDPFTRPFRCSVCNVGPIWVPLHDQPEETAEGAYDGSDVRQPSIQRECGKSN